MGKDLRGDLGAILGCMFSLGNIFIYTTCYFMMSWRTVAWLQLIPVSALWIFMFVVTESPYWLVRRVEEAREAFTFLRGEGSEEELAEIIKKKNSKEAIENGI